MWQTRPVGGHAIQAFNSPDRNCVFVRPRVSHDADALHRQQHRETLPQSLVPSRTADLVRDNTIRGTQQVEPRLRDLTEQTNRKARSGERLPHDKLALEPQVLTHAPDFVLEQIAKRFHELEIHALREAHRRCDDS